MGHYLANHHAPLGHNRCPVHPSEPLVGMCGCGTLFCRRCSPSTVFCGHCHEKHQRMMQRTRAAAIAHPGFHPAGPAVHGHGAPHHGHLPNRVVVEAVMMTALIVAVVAFLFQMQNQSFSFGSNAGVISFGIDAGKDPLQRGTQPFATDVRVTNGDAAVTSDTSYSISARVESKKKYDDAISTLIPYDLLLSWGKMAESDVDGKLSWDQGDRQGMVSGSLGGSGPDVTSAYVIAHVSNNHLIPANDNIRRAIATIKDGDLVRIDGRLVDVRMKTDDSRLLTVKTSKSRTDQGDGACEIIYVESLRINGQSY